MRRLLDLLAPASCWACRAPLPGPAPPALCPPCAGRLPWLETPWLPADVPLAATFAPLDHAGPARALVHALKFHGAEAVAGAMAAQLAARAPADLLSEPAVIVPVPAHPLRARRRGFDHADALAAALAARSGLPLARVLRRSAAPGARQRGRPRAERLAAPARQFGAAGPAPARCLIVDDVRTTGATLRACAEALHAAGSRSVIGVSYARAAAPAPIASGATSALPKERAMRIEITGTNGVHVTDELRELIERRFAKIARLVDELAECDVIVAEEHNPAIATPHRIEAHLRLKGATLNARAQGREARMAVNEAAEELERQVQKRRDKQQSRRREGSDSIRFSQAPETAS